jgi:Na+/melibiose symporter-like transporter
MSPITITGIVLVVITVICLIIIGICRARDNAEDIQVIAGVMGVICLLFGIWCLIDGFSRRPGDITIHFLESDTYVTYENAYTYRANNGSHYVVTEDGSKIQIVNAEIIRDTGEQPDQETGD